MHVQFVNPWALVLLWLVPVIGLIWLATWRLQARVLERFLSPIMRQKLCPPPQAIRFYWQWALFLLGLLLALAAAARPQWGLREETVMQRGRDLIIALDVSRSMLAQDVHPNRLQRAKADIQDLLRELRGDRAALIAFRGKAIQLCPLTTDYAYLEQALAEVSPESAPRGETDIGDAITKALDAFESDASAYQAIILISDGDDLAGRIKDAVESARKKGVVIFTVGLGDPQGAKIPSSVQANAFMTYQGKDVISKLQHETLKSIAEITGGAYVPVGTANVKLGSLYRDHLSKMTARDIEESIQRRYIDRYQLFLLPALLAFLAVALLSRGQLGKTKKTLRGAASGAAIAAGAGGTDVRLALLIIAFALAVVGAQAQITQQTTLASAGAPGMIQAQATGITNIQTLTTMLTNGSPIKAESAGRSKAGRIGVAGRKGARHAQSLYRLGKYREAADAYLQAMPGQTTALQNDCLFNAACALYRAGQYQAAAERFTELTTRQAADYAAANYNLGCTTFQLAEQAKAAGTNQPPDAHPTMLEHAGQAFQRALRLRTDDAAARVNLGVVTNLLPAARDAAKIRALLERYQGTQPPQLADTMLVNQRKLIGDLPSALTNATTARISQLEGLSARERDNTDLLIPLKVGLASAMASMGSSTSAPQQAAQVGLHIEALQNTMQQTAENLRNLDYDAYRSALTAESGIYILWKGMVQFPQLLHEDIYRQTNTIGLTTSVLARVTEVELPAIRCQQNEAQELTSLFMERFSQAVPPGGMPPAGGTPLAGGASVSTPGAAGGAIAAGAPATNRTHRIAETNAPEAKQGITAETRSNILALAQQALSLQGQALRQIESTNLIASLPNQRQAYDLLKKIEKLLPQNKDQNQQQNNQQQNRQDNQQEGPKKDQSQKPQENPTQQPQPQPEDQQQQSSPPPPQPQPQPQPEKQDKDKEMTPEQARALLEKAQQRDKDHREERQRDPYIQPSPVERDW